VSIVITGSTGKLGRLTIEALLERGVEPDQIVATTRATSAAHDLQALGVQVLEADFADSASLDAAFAGAESVLIVSTTDVATRVENHRRAIEAASRAGVSKAVYTSMINAGAAQNLLARVHLQTEQDLRDSGLPFVILRNGWYLENYTEQIPVLAEHGVLLGAGGDGRVSGVSRRDLAEAAAAVLTPDGPLNAIYELAGEAFTLSELARTVSNGLERTIVYRDLSHDDFVAALVGVGLPNELAEVLADADAGLARGELFADDEDLATLIGRRPISMEEAVRAAVGGLGSPNGS
jgi:NAD(P)H dehydrogenase (quinone)